MKEYMIVKVQFNVSSKTCTGKLYTFLAYEEYTPGDVVVVDTQNGFQLATVEGTASKIPDGIPTGGLKEIVCKVDFTAWNERRERAKRMNELQCMMNNRVRDLQETALFEILASKDPELKAMLDEYKTLRGANVELYPHQQTALEETRQYSRVAYYLDMGLGKTFVGSEKMRELNSPVNLIVCQKSKVEDWEKHMIENYAMDHCWIIYNLTDKKDFERFFKEVKTRKSGDPTVCGIINYDLLFRRAEIAHLTGFTLMLDESSIIQNEGAKRSKFVLGLHPDNVILLSGTPTAGKYEKLWSQLHLLGWGNQQRPIL